MTGLILIQIAWQSDVIPERCFYKNYFGKLIHIQQKNLSNYPGYKELKFMMYHSLPTGVSCRKFLQTVWTQISLIQDPNCFDTGNIPKRIFF